MTLDPKLDTSLGSSSVSGRSRRRVMRKLKEMHLVDAWRIFHEEERDYTFYSNPHKRYSRLDYFLIPHYLLTVVEEVNIGNITWSDHSPVTLDIIISGKALSTGYRWRLNESLLQTTEVKEAVEKELGEYFRINDTPRSDPIVVWEAHKAVMRGLLIKHGARIKRMRENQVRELTIEIQTLEMQHKVRQSTNVGEELGHKRRELADLLRYKAKAIIQVGRRITYELGDKCGKILAGKLKDTRNTVYIPHIRERMAR